MAFKLPTYDPRVRAGGAPVASAGPTANADAFGAGRARDLMNFGQSLGQLGGTIQRIANVKQKRENDARVQFEEAQTSMDFVAWQKEQLKTRTGLAAANLDKDTVTWFEERRKSAYERLDNQFQRDAYDRYIQQSIVQESAHMADYAFKQVDAAERDSRNAKNESIKRDVASRFRYNDTVQANALEQIFRNIDANMVGQDEATTNLRKQDMARDYYQAIIEARGKDEPESALAFLEKEELKKYFSDVELKERKAKYMADIQKNVQDSLEETTLAAIDNGADELDVLLMQTANYGTLFKDTLKKSVKDVGVSEKEAAEFAEGQYLTDEMELSGVDIIRRAYQGRDTLSDDDANDLKLRLVAEAGWAPEVAERVVAMPRMKMMAKNAGEIQAGLDAYAEIRKAIADSNGDIQNSDLWKNLPAERQTLALAMQEKMVRRVEIDDVTQATLYGVLKSRRNADAGGFYQWMNNESRMMNISAVFADKPEMLRALMSGQPLDPGKIPSVTALSLEAGELMAGESALGKKIANRVFHSVDAFMAGEKKEVRDTEKARVKSAVVGDLMAAARAHKTTIEGLAPVERERVVNDGLLRYSTPGMMNRISGSFIDTYNDPVYGSALTSGQRVDSRIDPTSLPAAERLNLTAPAGIVSAAPSVLPADAGALVRVEAGIDLLQTPGAVQGRIRNSYGLRNDLSITQQLDTGIFIVVPPAGKGMIVARDGSVIDEIPEANGRAAPGALHIPDDIREMIDEQAARFMGANEADVLGWREEYSGKSEFSIGARVSGAPATGEGQ